MKQSTRSAWLLVLAYSALIVAVSAIPAKQMPESERLWRLDKLIHGGEYALLAGLVYRAMRLGSTWRPSVLVLVTVLGCALFGILDELHQSTVPGRDASALDALADLAGATFASIISAVLYSRQRSIRGHHPQL